MLIKLSTDKTVSEAATALQPAVQANHFRIMQVHIESNIRDEGEDAGQDERYAQKLDGDDVWNDERDVKATDG